MRWKHQPRGAHADLSRLHLMTFVFRDVLGDIANQISNSIHRQPFLQYADSLNILSFLLLILILELRQRRRQHGPEMRAQRL